jgi:hypothetical protein
MPELHIDDPDYWIRHNPILVEALAEREFGGDREQAALELADLNNNPDQGTEREMFASALEKFIAVG